MTVKPEVELGEYKGLTIKRNPVEVTSDEIDAEVNAAAEKNARFIEVSDRAAKKRRRGRDRLQRQRGRQKVRRRHG